MPEFFSKLFDTSDFPPRWHCGQWDDFHGWLHVVSDLLVFAAYIAIPFVLLFFIRRRRTNVPFPNVFYLFAAFIFACGTVHLIEATIFWWPIYRVSGIAKFITAVVSWMTVIGLIRIGPAALQMRGASELQAEVAERKSAEQKFRALLESAPDAIVIVSEDGNIEIVNKQTETLFGYDREELIGNPVETLIPERYQSNHPKLRDEFVKQPRIRPMGEGRELFGKRKNGTEFPIEISLSPIETDKGRLISSAIRDVSERVRIQHELAREKALFEGIVKGTADALMLSDMDRKITYCNPAVERVFGYQPSDLIGQPTAILYDNPDDHQTQGEMRFHREAAEELTPFEINWKHKNGSMFPGEAVGTVVRDHNGQPIGFLIMIRDITQRKGAEESLRIQERALQATRSGVVITDPNQADNPIVYVNNAAEMMSGYAAEEMLGKNCRFLQRDDRSQQALTEIRNAIKESRECNVELRNYRKDGTPFWNELIISPVRDDQGVLTHFVGIQTDITERKETEEALRKSEQRFAAFMDNSPFIAWVKDSEGRHEYFSRPYHEQIGIPDEDWQGKTDFELWPREIAESHQEMDAKVLESGEPFTFESNHPLPSGRTRHWHVIKFPFNIEEDKQVVGGIAIDVTEQRTAESERDRFFETSSDLMCIAEVGENLKRVNQAFSKTLGFDRAELLAEPFMEFVHPSDRVATENVIEMLAEGKQIVEFENRFRCRDGSYRLISWTTPAPESETQSIFLVGRDVTEKRSMERSLLQVADNEQRRIAHDLHDGLGQELAGMSMMAESLARNLNAKALPESKVATKIALQLESSLQLTRSLARGLRPVEIDSHGLESALTQLANDISQMHDLRCLFRNNTSVKLNDPETETHLYRIAQEAVTNAAKHGKPQLIEISVDDSGGCFELKVTDNGIGIQNTKSSEQGIGMKSMQYRCDLIGGKLRVEPGKPKGTIVVCELAAF